jgi:hypothetical protein
VNKARGDCYEAAAKLAVFRSLYGTRGLPEDFDPVLVHGRPVLQRPPFKKFGHGWVESGGLVFDFSNGRELVMPREAYYALGRIDPADSFHYSPDEARVMLVRFGHYGPWEGPEGCPPVGEEEEEEEEL